MLQIPVLVSRYTLLYSSLLMYFHAEIELLLAYKVSYTTIADTADTNCRYKLKKYRNLIFYQQ